MSDVKKKEPTKTLQQCFAEAGEAWRSLVLEVAYACRIDLLASWISKRLNQLRSFFDPGPGEEISEPGNRFDFDPDCKLYSGQCNCGSLWMCERYDPLEDEIEDELEDY